MKKQGVSILKKISFLYEMSVFKIAKNWIKLPNYNAKPQKFMFVILPGDKKIVSTTLVYAQILMLHGHHVSILVCDGLPACELTTHQNFNFGDLTNSEKRKQFCNTCAAGVAKTIHSHFTGDVYNFSDFDTVTESLVSLPELESKIRNAIKICYLSGSVRYNSHIPGWDDKFYETNETYKIASLRAYQVFHKAIDQIQPDVVISHHGIYVPMGLIPIVCNEMGKRYICWNFSYKDRTVIFSHKDSYHRTIPELTIEDIIADTGVDVIKDKAAIDAYVAKKISGATDWISYYDKAHKPTDFSLELIREKYDICHAVLTNISWDAYVNQFNESLPFTEQMEWLLHIIKLAPKYPDNAFVVRVHPAETNHPLKTRVRFEELLAYLGVKPSKNVFIIPSDASVSSHQLISISDLCHAFSSKIALEAVLMKKPVTLSGDAWVRNKNIGIDIKSPAELNLCIANAKQVTLKETQLENAYLFADYFFNRKSIYIPVLNKKLFSKHPFHRILAYDRSAFPMPIDTLKKLLNIFVLGKNY